MAKSDSTSRETPAGDNTQLGRRTRSVLHPKRPSPKSSQATTIHRPGPGEYGRRHRVVTARVCQPEGAGPNSTIGHKALGTGAATPTVGGTVGVAVLYR